MFAINILESAWLLYFAGLYLFHGEEYIYWPAVCLNWCLVQHSVKTQRHLLVCLFLTRLLSNKTPPPLRLPPPPQSSHPHSKKKSTSCGACKDVYNVFIFFLCEKNSQLFTQLPPFSRPSGVCVKCTLPWFFFIQYSVTCLCKFGLEKK